MSVDRLDKAPAPRGGRHDPRSAQVSRALPIPPLPPEDLSRLFRRAERP